MCRCEEVSTALGVSNSKDVSTLALHVGNTPSNSPPPESGLRATKVVTTISDRSIGLGTPVVL